MSSIADEHEPYEMSIEATARWAFRLGYFLLADRRDARSVLYQAAARLHVTALAQKKRQAKRPKGKVHKKISLTPRPLLQYLVYLCAEPYEYAQEQEHEDGVRTLTVEDMVVRYIKHLMMLYLEHNSFYATVGQSCVLFDFETSQAGRLYETLVQGSTLYLDTKGDYSVRDAKRELRRRLASRFGRFVTLYDGARKEQRFVTTAVTGRHFRFVKRCLHCLQPAQETNGRAGDWHLPAGVDLMAYDLAELQYDEQDGDQRAEQAAELRRLHVVTHPCCWARLLRAAYFTYSRRRLVLPEFILTNDEKAGPEPPDDRHRAQELTLAELGGLTRMLRAEARRRKRLFAARLSVSVDGARREPWDVRQDDEVKISVGREARVLAVSARDEEGEVLLAQHILQFGGGSRRGGDGPSTITLEGGQEFTFTVSPDSSAPDAGLLVTVGFRETKPLRAARRGLARSYERLNGALKRERSRRTKLKIAVAACAALLVALLAGWWVIGTRRQTPAVITETPQPLPQPSPGVDGGPPLREGAGPTQSPDEKAVEESGSRPEKGPLRPGSSDPADTGATRLREVVLSLTDGGGRVWLDGQGKVAGLEGLPSAWRRAVESVLVARRVDKPAVLEALSRDTEMLLGGPEEAGGAVIVGPAGSVVESDRPSFRWRALRGETSYTVAVYDGRYELVAKSDRLSATEWTCPLALRRGATYTWQVTAFRDGKTIVSPSPPAPEARFRVLGQAAAGELKRARRLYPASHLTLGVLYARAGMVEEAEREFRALAEANPDSAVAEGLLRSVRGWRRAK
jgi:hypothetical protein